MAHQQAKPLLDLPFEVLQQILHVSTTPSFLQLSLTCRKLFGVAAESREVVLHHLHLIPGLKLGLDDAAISTRDLFLILRQRAASHLYGANFTADAREFYFSRGTLDPRASYLALSPDYMNISLVLKNSLTLRIYGGHCRLKDRIESPYADGRGKILKVVHKGHTISILYAWSPELDHTAVADDHPPSLKGSTKHILIEGEVPPVEGPVDSSPSKSRHLKNWSGSEVKYHLIHYNIYNNNPPAFFSIPSPDPSRMLVPVDLAVYNRLKCAILWDVQGCLCPTTQAEVVVYKSERLPRYEEGTYTAQVMFPYVKPNTQPDANEAKRKSCLDLKPSALSFSLEGRKLKLYIPGAAVPYGILSTLDVQRNAAPEFTFANEVRISGYAWKVDTPFYGMHETIPTSQGQSECVKTLLSLGTTAIGKEMTGPSILCIIQDKRRDGFDDCRHTVELDSIPLVRRESGLSVVARLWGWRAQSSTLTGLETVAISKKGTRIAISDWDRVLVWSLEPRALCEEVDDLDSDNEQRRQAADAMKYYDRVEDEELGCFVVELKPIVLKLDGAVARKMVWRVKEVIQSNEPEPQQGNKGQGEGRIQRQNENRGSESSREGLTVPVDIEVRDETKRASGQAEPQTQAPTDMEAPRPVQSRSPPGSEESDAEHGIDNSTNSGPTPAGLTSSGPDQHRHRQQQHPHLAANKGIMGKRKHKRRLRNGEDELVVLTDRGLQMWDLGVWGHGRRTRSVMDGDWDDEWDGRGGGDGSGNV